MTYKGVNYTVAPTATPGVWIWQFQIGAEVKTGTTETKIACLAARRAQLKINREPKSSTCNKAASVGGLLHYAG